MSESKTDKPIDYDPIFLNSRREAVIIFLLWLVCLIWSVPFCYLNGYTNRFDPANFSTVMGIPSWIFWGIAAPWLLADIATTWFCFAYMKDDDVGVADDELPLDEASPGDSKENAS